MSTIIRRNGDNLVACPVDDYENLLHGKVERLRNLLSLTSEEVVDVFKSAPIHFRMRANFTMWRDNPKEVGGEMYYAMFDEKTNRDPYEIKSFPRGSVLINTLMQNLLTEIHNDKSLFDGLFETRFVTTQLGQAIIVLCYRKPLDDSWVIKARDIAIKLETKLIGRSRKKKYVVNINPEDGDDETIEEILNVADRELKYFQTEGAFSQPNAGVCEKMLEWSLNMTTESSDRDLLELYCGGGTFTAALASNFRKVLATEVSKVSVALAQRCFKSNNIDNVKVARLSSEEFTEAYTKNRSFTRLQDSGIRVSEYDFKTVFVDPPRSGLDADTCQLLTKFDRIVYISCNPETLARDLAILKLTHRLARVAAFDQFPYTHHLECGAYLVKAPVVDIINIEEIAVVEAPSPSLENDVHVNKRKFEDT